MDVFFIYEEQHFVWDEAKAVANFAKHQVRFEDACAVLLDPLVRLEDASVGDEFRLAALGAGKARRSMYVVHLERAAGLIRIISAREATKAERRSYEDNE